jgi:hypothetical protein
MLTISQVILSIFRLGYGQQQQQQDAFDRQRATRTERTTRAVDTAINNINIDRQRATRACTDRTSTASHQSLHRTNNERSTAPGAPIAIKNSATTSERQDRPTASHQSLHRSLPTITTRGSTDSEPPELAPITSQNNNNNNRNVDSEPPELAPAHDDSATTHHLQQQQDTSSTIKHRQRATRACTDQTNNQPGN